MPLVNKVVAMPLGANLDCDLRRYRGFVCVWVCVCVCEREHFCKCVCVPHMQVRVFVLTHR